MDKKAAKMEALRRAMDSMESEEYSDDGMEPHEVTCPNCGHTWMMGDEEEEGEYEDDTSES